MLWGKECLHVRGVGCGDAAAHGPQPPPHAADAHGDPIPHHVSQTGGIRHEHPVSSHSEAGQDRVQLRLLDKTRFKI